MPIAPIARSALLDRCGRALVRAAGARPRGRRAGQASTEWMLLLSVIVLAIVAAGYVLATEFGAGMDSLAGGAGSVYTSGRLGN